MKKKKVGKLYGRPLVEGDSNYINNRDILVTKEGKFITLAEKKKSNLQTLSTISSVGENYMIYNLSYSTYPDPHSKIDTIYNPNSLQEVFSALNTLYYSEKETTVINVCMTELIMNIYISEFKISTTNEWLNRDTFKNLIKDHLTFQSEGLQKMPGIKTYITILPFHVPFASFKNGHLKGISATTKTNYMDSKLSWNKAYFSSINYKGDSVEDKFEMAGFKANQANNITTDESYVIVMSPILFLCPLMNGIFTLGTLAGTSDIVLINCMEMDTKFIREALGLPESAVIPSKEGEYIKYPNIYVSDEAVGMVDAVSIENTLNENRQILLDNLKKKVASLEEIVNASTQEEKKAVVD